MEVKRTERGWAGHFCCAKDCLFRRNTLLEYGSKAIVVSTVGCMINERTGKTEEIGLDRDYETMAFWADKSTKYYDANVSERICFDSEWSLKIKDTDNYSDLLANKMHEEVVYELTEKLINKQL